ncbi:MAG: hypothetical protein IJ642_12570 [Oscillospiraceae bacterium]|nr:hypothetical protein [Oscillospiraceae bacterium]
MNEEVLKYLKEARLALDAAISVMEHENSESRSSRFKQEYALNVPELNLKGKPIAVILPDGTKKTAPAWKTVVVTLLTELLKSPENLQKARELCGAIVGNTRILLNNTSEDMRSPRTIADNIYIETQMSAKELLRFLGKVLDAMDISPAEIKVEISNA